MSLKEYGFRQPIVVDKNMVIVAGHTRYRASKKLGLKQVPISIIDNLFDPFLKAEIMLYNDNNAIERTVATDLNSQKGFTFRGDGRDVLFLEIIPLKSTDKEYKLEESKEYNQVFSLRNLFTVIEDTDIVVEGATFKKIKLCLTMFYKKSSTKRN